MISNFRTYVRRITNFSKNKTYSNLRENLKVKHYCYSTVSTMSTEKMCNDAKEIFLEAVNSVQPQNLIDKSLQVHSNLLQIQSKQFTLRRNAYIVGFGKAVLGMAVALEKKLEGHLVSGILSIPEGSETSLIFHDQMKHSSLQVYKGAANNIPDQNAQAAATKISELVTSLTESDLLFVLISGGGSALLPSPKKPISLEEKIKVIKLLASKGASIEELNIVRKRLSVLKGGGLAKLARPAQVISLILSDIIGDPLGSIASAPTVKNNDSPQLPLDIIQKYNLQNQIPPTVLRLLETVALNDEPDDDKCFSHVNNFIIGNNQIALDAAALVSKNLQYQSLIITNEFSGIARFAGAQLMPMVIALLDTEVELAVELYKELGLPEKSLLSLLKLFTGLNSQSKNICLLLGGETTVEVCGSGVGGRNQELALAAAVELGGKLPNKDIILLSSGTDGIDGPTDAAGALATKFVVEFAEKENADPRYFLNNNDSYTFYSNVCNGQFHFKIGHTGTNVMDIIIILIK